MVEMYLELTIILLSVIAVLSVLIVYIVRQTLAMKREYDVQAQKKLDEEKLWIDRRESENHILGLSEKLEKADPQQDEDTNPMVTFTKRNGGSNESVTSVAENGISHLHVHHHHQHQHVQHSEHFYANTTTDANEYSEYCVPNCEPIEGN